MKVALVQCPVWGTYDPPLALAQLSGCLKQAGHEVFVFDMNIKLYNSRTQNYKHMWAWEQSSFWYDEENIDKFISDNKALIEEGINKIADTDAMIVGFSISAASKLFSIKVSRMLKKINKDIIIIFGGPLFFYRKSAEEILKEESAVSMVMPGECEVALTELIDKIGAGKDISDCPGIVFMRQGRLVDTGPARQIADLDALPFLDLNSLPLTDYDDSRHIIFMASRGCIQRCVFCSSRAFYPGYRTMSGKRIFKEIEHHKKEQYPKNPHLGHINFLDLMFNGNMRHFVEFCDLMTETNLEIGWLANMIIRPEMTPDVIKKMDSAGCRHIIFGIESGSQRVLNLMKKHYYIKDADRIIRDIHRAGITVTCNFMFGFPGETESDFKDTLNFIERNAEFIDRVYPSRTYCAIEEHSYLAGHLEEFDIKPNPSNHLFWENSDGSNVYPERLRRCKEFSECASSLGIEVGNGVQTSVQLDELFNLFQYYETKNDRYNVVYNLLRYFELEPSNEIVINKIGYYFKEYYQKGKLPDIEDDIADKLKSALYAISSARK